MGFIGKQPTPVPLTSSDITDGIVTTTKIADTAISTAKIADDAVTGAKIENSPSIANGLTLTDGNLVVASGHGIDFSANSSASGMTSELFDDYEEGTWTPQLTDGSTNIGTTVNSAIYSKIGDVVHCEFNIQRNDSASNSNYMQVSGLPFAHTSIPALVGQAWIDNTSGDIRSFLYLPSGNTSLYFAIAGSSGDYVRFNAFSNDRYIYAGFQYKV